MKTLQPYVCVYLTSSPKSRNMMAFDEELWDHKTAEKWYRATDVLALLSEREWQDISTAPKDGTWFLAWGVDGGFYTYRDGPGLISSEEPSPTHWHPLPAAPGETR